MRILDALWSAHLLLVMKLQKQPAVVQLEVQWLQHANSTCAQLHLLQQLQDTTVQHRERLGTLQVGKRDSCSTQVQP